MTLNEYLSYLYDDIYGFFMDSRILKNNRDQIHHKIIKCCVGDKVLKIKLMIDRILYIEEDFVDFLFKQSGVTSILLDKKTNILTYNKRRRVFKLRIYEDEDHNIKIEKLIR